jgi:metal-sulfur cluster biosynthetic enzyme
MDEASELKKKVVEKLSTVIDPETGTDIIRMRLIQDLEVDQTGKVTYTFRPSSPLCPIAAPLSLLIIKVIHEIPGVTGQAMTVVDYVQAEQLNELLKTILTD